MTTANFQAYQKSQEALSLANTLREAYSDFKKVLGVVTTLILASIALLFVRPLFWFLIWMLKRNYNPKHIQLTTENYASYLKSHEALGKEIKRLEEGIKIDEKNIPWILRGIIKDFKRLNSITLNYYNDLSKAINGNTLVQEGELFSKVSPIDLWNRRNKTYSYKL